ncbi:GSCOCG00002080001-RA-CDS, partial [Cotesia congregata]
ETGWISLTKRAGDAWTANTLSWVANLYADAVSRVQVLARGEWIPLLALQAFPAVGATLCSVFTRERLPFDKGAREFDQGAYAALQRLLHLFPTYNIVSNFIRITYGLLVIIFHC